MPTFEWKGRGRTGETAGVLVADSKDAVVASLRRQQIVVTAVKEKGRRGSARARSSCARVMRPAEE